ncbi:MAG: acyl-CoA mutase large subunit family protein [Candidatus Aminicenantia bacterium]
MEKEKEIFTVSGILLKEFFTPDDVKDSGIEREVPGEYPFTRGIHRDMYRKKLWTMRQYAGFGTAEESNRRYKYLLEQGQTGLSVAFDLPTQIGLDSDSPLSSGEIGKVGVAISCVPDMEILFKDIPLEEVSVSMTINATAFIILPMFLLIAEKRGNDWKKLRGTIQNDILKEYIARGTYIFPPEPSMRITGDLIEFLCKNVPQWNFISISGYHIREAGANAVQELSFTFANAIAYVEELKKRMDVDEFAPRLSFFFAAHNNFFEEVAKFRAGRRIWAKIMRERFGASDPRSWMLRFHTQTSGSTLTYQQPENNIIRVTLQALSAILGGTQSLHTNSLDEALALPSEKAVKIALRTQQIIAYETSIPYVVDPLGGSYYIEYLTNEIEKRVFEYLDRIEKIGGALKAIESGWIQEEIANSAYRAQKRLESKEDIVVGVNMFTEDKDKKPEIVVIPPEVEENQKKRLKDLKSSRDLNIVKNSLEKLKEIAKTEENLIPYVLDALKKNATLGEIVSSLKEIYGTYKSAKKSI